MARYVDTILKVLNRVFTIATELEWTTTHGHFVQMGGLEGIYPDGRREVINPLYFGISIGRSNIDMDELRFSKNQLNDCSKSTSADVGLAALQISGFILQWIARYVQNLPITALESVTFVFALLNIITYILWWDKPLNTNCQRTIHIKDGHIRDQHKKEGHLTTIDADPDVKGGIGKSLVHGLKYHGDRLLLRPFRVLVLPLQEMVQCQELDPGARHVPTFYALPITDLGARLRSAACELGFLLSGIYLLENTYQFPTQFEFILWWCSAIVTMVIPIVVDRIITRYTQTLPPLWSKSPTPTRLEAVTESTIKFLVYYAVPILYILARFSLVSLAFLALCGPQPGIC